MKTITGIFRVLFTPMCWIQNEQFSRQWDDELNRLIETDNFIILNNYNAKIGNKIVWIKNHPYASFTLTEFPGIRPSRITILRAHDKLITDILRGMK